MEHESPFTDPAARSDARRLEAQQPTSEEERVTAVPAQAEPAEADVEPADPVETEAEPAESTETPQVEAAEPSGPDVEAFEAAEPAREAPPTVLAPASRLPHGLLHRVELALAAPKGRDVKLERVCQVLAANVEHYHWVGFYLTDPAAPRELVLGPYVGEPTEHARIPFGKGICGQAADRGETFVVQDVSQESNYLSCSPYVKSEIVVPILRDGQVLGELDIDSHELAPFTDEDRLFLEQVAALVADVL